MTLIACGVNHATAPIDIREKISFSNEVMSDALNELKHQNGINEAAILSTCNRTEIYCNIDKENNNNPINWLHNFHGIKQGELKPFVYKYPDVDAIRHILRVACGLDSMILGESQVLGQLKTAYQKASTVGSIGHQLNRLFQHSFYVAKKVRSNTKIGDNPISIAYAAVRLAKQIFGDLERQTVLLIGAGEMIELAARHLYDNGLRRMIIANRTLERSQQLANQYSVYAIQIGDIPKHLAEADIIISSTASQLPILGKGAVENAIKERKHKPIFIVDIAIPRDVEKEVGEMDDVYLYTIDDLKDIVQENLRNRQASAIQAEEIINIQTHKFVCWLNSLDAVSTIRSIRNQALNIQKEVLAYGICKIQNGADPEQVLKYITRNLTNKLIHLPSAKLRKASEQNRVDLLNSAKELYDLNNHTTTKTDD